LFLIIELICAIDLELVSLGQVDVIISIAWAEALPYEVPYRWFLPRDLRPPKEDREVIDPDQSMKFWEYTRTQIIKSRAPNIDSLYNVELVPLREILPRQLIWTLELAAAAIGNTRIERFIPVATMLRYIQARFEMIIKEQLPRMPENYRTVIRLLHERALTGLGDFVSFKGLECVSQNDHLINESKPQRLGEIEAESGAEDVPLQVRWVRLGSTNIKLRYVLIIEERAEEWFG
jgi:hypothetical protein